MTTTPGHKCCSCSDIHWRRSAEEQARTRKVEVERDKLRDYQERTGSIMAYLVMMMAAYDTDPEEPLDDDAEISSFCASGMSGVLSVGMVRKALEAKT